MVLFGPNRSPAVRLMKLALTSLTAVTGIDARKKGPGSSSRVVGRVLWK